VPDNLTSDALHNNGPDVALGELGRAITRAADALASIPGDDTATAYRCARALDIAFGDLIDLLQAVPGVAGLGDPGQKVSQRLEQRRAELEARRGEVTAHRARLDNLAEIEQSLANETAEADRLRERVQGLDRARQLAAWSQADAVLVEGLQTSAFNADGNALETMQTELNSIRDQLIGVDDRLRPMLREVAEAYEEARKARPL